MMVAGVSYSLQGVLRLRLFLTREAQTYQKTVAVTPLGSTVASLFLP